MDIVPITPEHFKEVYGLGNSYSIRGFAGLVDGKTVAVAGVYYLPDQIIAFCNIKPEAKHMTKALARGTLQVLRMIKDMKVPVLAIADPDMPEAEDFLMRCGFEYFTKGPNGEVFVCRL